MDHQTLHLFFYAQASHGAPVAAPLRQGYAGLMSNFLKSNKRRSARPMTHLASRMLAFTHVGFHACWLAQQHLQDGGISRSTQEINLPAVMEVV
jgi:hypothetical protein